MIRGQPSCKIRYDLHSNIGARVNHDVSFVDDNQGVPAEGKLNELMKIAYGDKLLYSDGGSRDFPWCQRWSVTIQHLGQHYSLPGGSTGKHYVELLCDELRYLSLGTYCSERLIVFCSLMLQRDRFVRKGCDIRRLLERRMKLW